jgi:MFS transporter, DHA1 family, inner membrane transport protein
MTGVDRPTSGGQHQSSGAASGGYVRDNLPGRDRSRPVAGDLGAPLVAQVLYERRPLAAIAAVAALGTAAFCFVTTENLPVGLLPIIAKSLKSSVPEVGLLVSAYALVVVVASAPLTHLTKHIPRRFLVCSLMGVFIVGGLGAAAATDYWWLLGARAFTAMAQAVFWSVAAVTAVGLFPPAARARAVAGVLGGGSLAVVLGVPTGTWLGQQGGWRLPFVALSALATVSLIAVARLLPTINPSESHAAVGAQPNRRRFYLLIFGTVLLIAGFFTSYTYISTYLTRVSGLPAHDVAPVLLVAGFCSVLGVVAAGVLFDRFPRLFTIGPFALQAGGLLGLWALGRSPVGAVVFEAVAGVGIGTFVIANQNRVLIVAPGSSEVASAWSSASFNLGIGGGSLVGSAVLSTLGAHATALAGAVLGSFALLFIVVDQLRLAPPARTGPGAHT